ncbi:DNA-processing protein DprA [Mycolicibacterium duvalii]|uniref:Smf/DprA SLOG domain-containing protein n=1 Tax=Mycolicibacterium duvalii TaxID=39688 RepID=A0A7I7K5C7_9MYCO|nr:DNA-processing protein DprA [Mycolicibacterium duvalii]MCV7367721.1 DNA-processing protein DprA [Mycolicibacterium duvalii]BBX18689.1 hypothetical protein MDUV_35490 [Mycolicibacterium duvalii]
MTPLNDADLAAIALTSRLVGEETEPLSAREFWELSQAHEPSNFLGLSADEIVTEYSTTVEMAERITHLLNHATGLAIAIETLDHSGIWTMTGLGQNYPKRLRQQLRDDRPVVLHGVGETGILSMECIGIVGDSHLTTDAVRVTQLLAESLAKSARAVVSRVDDGVGRQAMNAAFEADGSVIGVPEVPLQQVISRPRIRKGVIGGRICLVTSDAPSTPVTPSQPGVDRLVYGISDCTIVMACARERGPTWDGALDAIERGYGRIVSWVGAGSGPSNRALVDAGAEQLADVAQLSDLVSGRSSTSPAAAVPKAPGDQLWLDFGSAP